MVQGFYAQLTKLLKAHGCTFVRTGKGDHEIWHSPITDLSVTVDRGVMSRHTANAVLKRAGIRQRL
ncbi:MAG: type II toxin-antitoxin system HicA family toxin [Devosia sp.]